MAQPIKTKESEAELQHKRYSEYLLFSDYAQGTVYNYLLYFRELQMLGIDREGMRKIVGRHNNKNIRPFLKSVCQCFKIKYSDLDIPKLKGRQKQSEIIYYTPQEIRMLVRNSNVEQKILILLMYESGLRISEIVDRETGLRKKGIDFENLTVKGMGKGNKPFTMPISTRVATLLYQYTRDLDENDLVFQWRCKNRRQHAWYLIRKLQLFLPNKPLSCHNFRHSCATNLYRQEKIELLDIKEFLRHVKLQTVEHYASVDKEKLHKKAIKMLEVKDDNNN